MIWRPSYNSRIAQVIDIAVAFLSFLLTFFVAKFLHNLDSSLFAPAIEIKQSIYLLAVLLSISYKILFDYQKAYSYQRFTSIAREYAIVFKVCFMGLLITIALTYLFGYKDIPRSFYVLFFVVSLVLFLSEKTSLFYIASYIRKKGKDRKRILLIGTGTRARNFINVVKENFHWGLDIVGLLTGDRNIIGNEVLGIKILDHYDNIQKVLKTVNPEEVIITISTKRFDQIRNVLEICEKEGVMVRLNSDFFGYITKNVTVDNIFGLNIISFDTVRRSEFALFVKRLIDIIGSLVAIILFSPFMLIAIIGILVSDGFPIFYTFIGYGLNKKPVKIYKFRTMVKNSEEMRAELNCKNEMDGPVFKIKEDPRITPFGKWLRKFSVDETPQLFSVLLGRLSLVGPRHAMKDELDNYESWHRRRLSVKPGLTCLWQVDGRNEIFNFDDWVKLDLKYIDEWSILLDIKILLKTIPVVLFGKGV